MKRRLIKTFAIAIPVSILLFISLNLFFNSMVTAKFSYIEVSGIDESYSRTDDEYHEEYFNYINELFKLNENEKKDVSNNLQKYKIIDVFCNTMNNLPIMIRNIQVNGNYSDNLSKIIVGKICVNPYDQPYFSLLFNGETEVLVNVLIKPNSKTNKEIISYVKESKFSFNGHYGPFTIKWNLD